MYANNLEPYKQAFQIKYSCSSVAINCMYLLVKHWTCSIKIGGKNSKIKNLLSAGKWIFNMLQPVIRKTMKTKIAHFGKQMKIETGYNGDKILRFKRSRLYGSPTKTTQPLKNIKHQ